MLILPRRFNQQPQQAARINTGHPLARGLVAYQPLSVRPSADLSDGVAWSVVAPTTPIAFDSGARGLGMRVKGTASAYVSRPVPAALGLTDFEPLTLRFRLSLRAVSAQHAIMAWGTGSQDGTPRFYVRVGLGNLSFFYGGGYRSYTAPVVAGGEYIVTHTFDGSQHSTYVNGVLIGQAFVSWSANTSTLFLGMGYDGLQPTADFLLSDFAMWKRSLSAQEAASDAQNPWQMLAAPQRDLWSFTAASGGAPVGVQAGTGALTLAGYPPTLAQTASKAIAPRAGSFALTGYAPTVAVGSAQGLTAGVGNLALTGYAPTLAQTANQAIGLAASALTLTGFAPSVGQTDNKSFAPAAGAIIVSGFAPTVRQAGPTTAVFPPPSLVAAGVVYGPSGNDFTGTYAGGGMTDDQNAMLTALATIHGLVPGAPLIVSQTSRTAGAVVQTISESAGIVTIARA